MSRDAMLAKLDFSHHAGSSDVDSQHCTKEPSASRKFHVDSGHFDQLSLRLDGLHNAQGYSLEHN